MPYHMYPETPKLMGPIVTGDVHVFPPTKFYNVPEATGGKLRKAIALVC